MCTEMHNFILMHWWDLQAMNWSWKFNFINTHAASNECHRSIHSRNNRYIVIFAIHAQQSEFKEITCRNWWCAVKKVYWLHWALMTNRKLIWIMRQLFLRQHCSQFYSFSRSVLHFLWWFVFSVVVRVVSDLIWCSRLTNNQYLHVLSLGHSSVPSRKIQVRVD